MQKYVGHLNAQGQKHALVVAKFNQTITQRLLEGALEGLKKHGVAEEDISVAWVPGAFELPLVAKRMAESKKYDAVTCLGAVIRGETAHFDFVADQAASGILHASLSSNIPVIFSVLTTETKEQAEMRAGKNGVNVGFDYSLAAIEMVNLLNSL